jgi:hypothetical protein
MAGLDVLIVRAAIEHDVALRFAVSCIRVVGDSIGMEDVIAVVNHRLAPKVVNRSFLLLFHRGPRNFFFYLAGGGWR